MPISVAIQDESGAPEGEPWWHPRSTELLVADHPGTCCLRFIDAYGDTTFNQAQLPVLIGELEALRARLRDPELIAVHAALLAYLRQALDQVHIYVRFSGD